MVVGDIALIVESRLYSWICLHSQQVICLYITVVLRKLAENGEIGKPDNPNPEAQEGGENAQEEILLESPTCRPTWTV